MKLQQKHCGNITFILDDFDMFLGFLQQFPITINWDDFYVF